MSIKPMEKFYVGLGMPKSDFFDWGCRKSDGWLPSAFKTNVKHTCDYVAGELRRALESSEELWRALERSGQLWRVLII